MGIPAKGGADGAGEEPRSSKKPVTLSTQEQLAQLTSMVFLLESNLSKMTAFTQAKTRLPVHTKKREHKISASEGESYIDQLLGKGNSSESEHEFDEEALLGATNDTTPHSSQQGDKNPSDSRHPAEQFGGSTK